MRSVFGVLLGIVLCQCTKSAAPSNDRPRAHSSVSASAAVRAPAPPVTSAAAPTAPAGDVLPVITGAGIHARVRDSGRKGAIVSVFASWCGPCRQELPMLQALAPNLALQGIDFLLVSVDEPEDAPKAVAFLKSLDTHLPAYMAERPLGDFKQGLYPRWPGMLPATFLLDATGKVRYFWGGPVNDDEILTIVDGFLAGRAVDGESDFTLAPGTVERQP